MDKPAIKKFAVWARKKLIADTKYRAGLVGVTETTVAEPLPQSNETVQFFDVGLPQPYRIEGDAVTQRQRFVAELNKETAKQGSYTAAYQTVVDKVAYTWFNRLIAVRYMEVNDLLPSRTRVLSSADGRAEPQIVTSPFDAMLDYTPAEQQQIVSLKNDNKLDEAFRLLFLKQCAALGDCLPYLFDTVDSYMNLLLSITFTDTESVIYRLVHDIDESDWKENPQDEKRDINAIQIVGWLYQEYNTDDNNLVYDGSMSKSRIPKELLPAATTIYTPDWATLYMVQNSLGRLWCEGHPDFVKPEKWKYYLNETEQAPETKEKLAEIRKDYATLNPQDIKCIDPCSGSGHILVHMFDVLMDIYNSAGYTKRDAVRSVLENNLYGLDVSERAAQLSYFAVMMKALRYDKRFLTRKGEDGKADVPQAQVYEIEESNALTEAQKQDILATFESQTSRNIIEYLFDTLKDAKEYGSILRVKRNNYGELLNEWKKAEYSDVISFYYYENQKIVSKLLREACVLSQQYDVVVTNPPYLAFSRFSPALDTYVKKNYPDEKADLSAVMFKKATTDFVKPNGFVSFITTSSWMFLSSFEKFRTFMMHNMALDSIVDFGTELFDGKVGHNPITAWVNRNTKMDFKMTAIRLVDYCYSRRDEKEPEFFKDRNRYIAEQDNFSKIPGSPVAYWISQKILQAFINCSCIGNIARPRIGQNTGDNNRFLRMWYEVCDKKITYNLKHEEMTTCNYKWLPYNKGGEFRRWYGNQEYVINWENDGQEIKEYAVIRNHGKHWSRYIQNVENMCKPGVTWSFVTSGTFSVRYLPQGFICDVAGSAIFPEKKDIFQLVALCNSKFSNKILSILNPTINMQASNVASIPVEKAVMGNNDISKKTQTNISLSKSDWDSFETSWDFAEHPLVKWSRQLRDATSIGATMAYYYHGERPEVSCPVELCYMLWQGECNDRFAKLKANEEELNRIFIDIYGLQDELTPKVEDKDVTVRRADLARDIRSLISYAVGCIFGRYSLDKTGLVFAGGDFDKIYWKYKGQAALDENGEPIGGGYAGISLAEYHYPKFHDTDDWETATSLTFEPDVDNVIPITDEEYFTDDLTGLFVAWVKKAFGQDYLEQNLAFIAKALGTKGTSPRAVIRNYFLNGFYADHVKIYQKRPIYWLYDSGKQNGFKALIYMHRYNADTSGLVRADYLYKMEQVYESEIARMDDAIAHGASREVAQATKRKEKLVKQLKECKDYDDRLGHIALARIPIDLDDGVKVNYEKVQTGADGKKQAILAKI